MKQKPDKIRFVSCGMVKSKLLQVLLALYSKNISETACRVFLILAGCSDNYHPSHANISMWSGLQLSRVKLGLLELEDYQIIKTVAFGRKGVTNNKYKFIYHSDLYGDLYGDKE